MWIMILFALVVLLVIFLLNFYKDPKRTIPHGNNILSPADGRVISIIDTSKSPAKIKKNIFGKIRLITKDVAPRCSIVSIFMSPIDAHINRAPIQGTVKFVKHTRGAFFRAYDLEKSFENEKNEIIIENKQLKVKVIQIAGFLARRIKCYVQKNQKVNKGAKIGMIVLSSQTTLVIPAGVELKVRLNDRVLAGETIIATLNKNGR